MRLVCHIGTPKTGSTYLQESCARNIPWLARQGVVWPDLMSGSNHLTLFYATSHAIHPFARDYGLRTQDDVAAFRDRLTRRIRRQVRRRMPVMLMSSEFLTGNFQRQRPQALKRLAGMLRPLFDDGIRILVYLRRQDDAILSMHAEHLRRGFSGFDFESFTEAAIRPDRPILPYLAYDRLLEDWAAAFGREAIDVRLYDRRRLADGGLLGDFLSAVLGPAPDMAGFSALPETNVSLSAPALEFLRRLHPYLPLYRDGMFNPAREALRPKIDALPALPRPRMPLAAAQRIMDRYARSNARTAADWFPEITGPLFPPPARGRRPEGNLGQISLDSFARLTAQLLG
jgi:hypothetical protein